jgi:hypothetical protein
MISGTRQSSGHGIDARRSHGEFHLSGVSLLKSLLLSSYTGSSRTITAFDTGVLL